MKIALLSGTSGLIGMQLLHQLLKEDEFDYVISVGRRKLALKHARLVQVEGEMEEIEQWDWQDKVASQSLGGEYHEVISSIESGKASIQAFCSLGTTIRQAGSQKKFRAIDHGLVLAFARWSKGLGASSFLYVSALGADANSKVFYNQVKGEVERDLKLLGFDYLGLFRPSLLLGNRHEFRFGEEIAKITMKPLVWLKLFKNIRPIYDYQVAKSMVIVARDPVRRGIELISSGAMQDISEGV